MRIVVTGKQIDIGDALRTHVESHLEGAVNKYFNHPIEGTVTFSKDAHLFRADCHVHLGHGMDLMTHAEETDIYAAFDAAVERMEKRLRRYKRRLTNHHNQRTNGEALIPAQYNVLAVEEDEVEEPEDGQPAIVAETETQIPEASVSEAVMRLDLGNLQTLMFRNRAHGRMNVVYRRADGNIGWIDPQVD
ncbi:ribosome hibernation-promoting factor, HPF/YfiA family [Luteithermobacter gelatinilyticus]|uniref:ribosome hibernation-promoting factor, HPF/YfiA family n=1 Tax=Luteithermobacter gelatinilyticus TaxID=2582913 RepID=UPI001105AC33|nr:ribosome-associated translation inhibitor RaiA [Luteithermobacter gelatinilyticus]|tara:strand:- start:972 stop:1541 length:570 start_codon:yes stop_codon:yes gene_type:complete